MKKLMNRAEDFIPEMLEGLYAAHGDQITYADDKPTCLVSCHKKENKVAIVTGGGSGHLPLFLGYVGDGMLDGCAIGGIFQSPSADDMLTVTKAVEAGKGVLYILGNYNGDKYNFKMAGEMADMEYDIETASVIAGDDVASGPVPEPGEVGIRRGVAGIFFVYKCAGAAADFQRGAGCQTLQIHGMALAGLLRLAGIQVLHRQAVIILHHTGLQIDGHLPVKIVVSSGVFRVMNLYCLLPKNGQDTV